MPTRKTPQYVVLIEGERNIQGFFTAYLSVNAYYLTAPEVELNHGYCDLFLMPDLLHYEVNHSYIIELKYLSEKDSDAKAEIQWEEAVEQIKGYAAAPKVRQLIQNTKLHCIVMQFRGWELQRMEEVIQPHIKNSTFALTLSFSPQSPYSSELQRLEIQW